MWNPEMVVWMALSGLVAVFFWFIVIAMIVSYLHDWDRRHHGGRHRGG